MKMKDYLADATFVKKQRTDAIFSGFFIFMSIWMCLLGFRAENVSLQNHCFAMALIIGLGAVMMQFSRQHRREHKQIYDMLVELRKQKLIENEQSLDT